MTDQVDRLQLALRNAAKEVERLRAEKQALVDDFTSPIAVVGMGCRFPGEVNDPESFWRLLEGGIDAITEMPRTRWDVDSLYDPDPDAPGKMVTRFGGFISGIDQFDPDFFGISPREAAKMDPQQRLLLETTWEAMERSGIVPEHLMDSDTGVFVGLMYHDYRGIISDDMTELDGNVATGTSASIASGRISYQLGLKGPSLTVDTACSSSLVTVHLACQALRNGECSVALAGGVTLMLTPAPFVEFSRLRGLAVDGRCKAFSAAADGVSWGEGCGMLVLKRLRDALREHDPILAVIRGSAVNQDGRSNGLTAPNGPSQQVVIRKALAQARLAPAQIDYVECHGTGTRLGDPIEVQALATALAEGRTPDQRVTIGSVKCNIGHTQAAAGVAGLMKVILALGHARIPKNLNLGTPSSHIPWGDIPVRVATEGEPWKKNGAPRRAGVSSFGLSGTNAHMILEEAPPVEPDAPAPDRAAELVVISAKSEVALNSLAHRLAADLRARPQLALGDLAYSLVTTRGAMDRRLAFVAGTHEELCELLDAAASGSAPPGAVRGRAKTPSNGRLVFVFPGQGSQWLGMGQRLLAEESVFREAMESCDRAIRDEAGFSVLAELTVDSAASRLDRIDVVQPVLFSIEVALAALWQSWGIQPDVVVGHSMGEVAAAYVAGALSLEDAAAVICQRSRLLRRISGQGEMALVGMSVLEAESALSGYEDRLSVAVSNSPRFTVLSGQPSALAEVLATAEAKGIFCRRVKVDVASHSPQVDQLHDELISALADVSACPVAIPMYSTVSDAFLAGTELTAEYWADNLRQPVRFAQAVQALIGREHSVFIEVSPHPILLPSLEEVLGTEGCDGLAIGSLRNQQDGRKVLLESLGALWANGYPVPWNQQFPHGGRRVPLPTYPWHHERYWFDGKRRPEGFEAADPIADWFYRLDWPERRRAEAASCQPTLGPWLVLMDRTGLGEAVTKTLTAQGCTCTVLGIQTDDTKLVDHVSAALAHRNDWSGVLYLWGLDGVAPDGASASEIGDVAHRVAVPVLALVRALNALKNPPRLWITTRGACAVNGSHVVAPCQSTLWGLGRVVALEHPALWGGLVDLEPEARATDADALVAELVTPDVEDQLAFRNGHRHVARLIATRPEKPAELRQLSAEGTYLVTGGLGALGLRVAKWLVEHGAKYLLLTGRRGLSTLGATEAVAALQAQGARISVAAVDVADSDEMRSALDAIEQPLRGVVHAAGVGEIRSLADTDGCHLDAALRSKVVGGWVLHTLLKDHPLDFFVLFSSGAGVWGGAGQGSYAAANAFLDGFAHFRRYQSLPALSIDWGMWSESGMGEPDAQSRLAALGVLPMSTSGALTAMERLLGGRETQCTVARMDWARFAPVYASRRQRNFLTVLTTEVASSLTPRATASERWSGKSVGETRLELVTLVRGTLASVLGVSDPETIDPTRGFAEQGLNSLMAVQIRNRLQTELGVTLPATVAFDHPSVERLGAHLLTEVLNLEEQTREHRVCEGVSAEQIAIIGTACRFPGDADCPEAYWQVLARGEIAAMDVPNERWSTPGWYDSNPDASGRSYVAKAGFLRDVATFDASFFRISPREATSLDPQQRLLLEVSWEALERAGLDPTTLRESPTGVFIGAAPNQYLERIQSGAEDDVYSVTGNSVSFTAGRTSFVLGLQGPSLTVDAACASSLVATHLACQSLRQGECDLALAGGVSLLLSPRPFVAFSMMRALSRDGRCKPFSAEADGYGRAEGCGVLVLKRLSDARRDGDQICGIIRGTAVNHDGPSSGLTVPNGPAQQAVIRKALKQASVEPDEVDFVECHGTGTSLGDPIEVQAVAAVYGKNRPPDKPLVLGAAKANIGHMEAAAGIGGLLKVILAMQHETIPAQPNLGGLNPHLRWEGMHVAVPRVGMPWPRGVRPRRAGVSAFGLCGTNAHVILEEPPSSKPSTRVSARVAELLVLSAKTERALDAQAARLLAHVDAHPDIALGDVAFSLAKTRTAMEHRLAVPTMSHDQLRDALRAAVEGKTPPGGVRGRAKENVSRKVAFVFPGQGSQWLGMGKQLVAQEPAFRAAMEACDRVIRVEAGFSVLEELAADASSSRLDRIDVVQPVLFAVEVAISALWQSWGVKPDAVVGHSMGEVAAAHVAGALTLEDAAAVICRRSRLLRRISGDGAMAVVELTMAEAESALLGYEDRLSVAASNSPRSTVVSGEPAALFEVMKALEDRGIFCRHVKVDVASHSPQVQPLLEELSAALSGLAPGASDVPILSTVTGAVVTGKELLAKYWADNLRKPVRFGHAVQALVDEAYSFFVEMAPHPILLPSIEDILETSGSMAVTVGSLRRNQDESLAMLESLGALWVHGLPVPWERVFSSDARRVPLPTYPWQRERFWIESEVAAATAVRPAPSANHERTDDSFMELDWPRSPVPSPKLAVGRWLLLGGVEDMCARLASALEDAGHAVLHVVRPNMSASSLRSLVGDSFAGQGPTGIVYFASLAEDCSKDTDSIEEVLELGCENLLQLVHVLGDAAQSAAPRLWLVTRRAQALDGGDVSLIQSPLLGLSRVIAMEHPELRCSCVDLDAADPNEAPNGLLSELLADDLEEETAWRRSERYVARLTHWPSGFDAVERIERSPSQALGILNEQVGSLKHLVLRPAARRPPCVGEVEIAVEAAGLNYLDVLSALGVVPGKPGAPSKEQTVLGLECAGRVVTVGEGVDWLSVGEHVVALTWGAFATHVTTSASLVWSRPESLPATEAAVLPVAYLTAWHALETVARLRRGERILIHGAASSLGLAALQWAKHLGAQVFATAGTPERREYLAARGIEHVSDSCSDRFAKDVLEWTGGEGVDVVFLPLSDDAAFSEVLASRTVPLLHKSSRFVEFGACRLQSISALEVKGLSNCSSFLHTDLHQLAMEEPVRLRAVFNEILELIASGVLARPMVEAFPAGCAVEAFEKMAKSEYVSNLVLTLDESGIGGCASTETAFTVRADSSYLVTGALGDVGMSVAGLLVGKGAGHLVLVDGTRALNQQQSDAIAAFSERGISVSLVLVDISDELQVEGILRDIATSGKPLRGVVHAAGNPDDATLVQQDAAQLRRVLASKVRGALHLHHRTRDLPLDFFVLCSSVSGLMGLPRRGGDAAASTFLDALAHHRRSHGLPGLSVDWGPWDVATATIDGVASSLAIRGMRRLSQADGLFALMTLLERNRAQTAVLSFDPQQWIEHHPNVLSSRMLSRVIQPGGDRSPATSEVARQLAFATSDQKLRLLEEFLRKQLSRVLRTAESNLDVEVPFPSLGMDSLMGLELRKRIEVDLGIKISAVLLWTHPTIAELSQQLVGLLESTIKRADIS